MSRRTSSREFAWMDGARLDIQRTMVILAEDNALDAIVRAARFRASMHQVEQVAVMTSSVSDPTASQALDDRKVHNDPRTEHIRVVQAELAAMSNSARRLRSAVYAFTAIEAKERGRKAVVDECRACLKSVSNAEGDRLKSAYCEACFKAWCRSGRPDRLQFELSRRVEEVQVDTLSDTPSHTP